MPLPPLLLTHSPYPPLPSSAFCLSSFPPPCSSMADMAMEGRWEGKGVAVFYLELTLDMLHLLVYCAFFAVVFSTYGIPLHLVSGWLRVADCSGWLWAGGCGAGAGACAGGWAAGPGMLPLSAPAGSCLILCHVVVQLIVASCCTAMYCPRLYRRCVTCTGPSATSRPGCATSCATGDSQVGPAGRAELGRSVWLGSLSSL